MGRLGAVFGGLSWKYLPIGPTIYRGPPTMKQFASGDVPSEVCDGLEPAFRER